MAVSPADLDQYPPEGAGGDEADLHKHVPDDIFRLAQRPGPLRDALEAQAVLSNFPVQTVFGKLLAHCFVRCVDAGPEPPQHSIPCPFYTTSGFVTVSRPSHIQVRRG